MRINIPTFICVIVLVTAGISCAHETDQYTIPLGRETADMGPWLNDYFYNAIDKAVTVLNRATRPGKGPQSPDEVAQAVYDQLPWDVMFIEDLNEIFDSVQLQKQHPGEVMGYKDLSNTVLKGYFSGLDWRQILHLFVASTFKAYGSYMGTDKIGHFMGVGMTDFRAYRKVIRAGGSEGEALKAGIYEGTAVGGSKSERGNLGLESSGLYCNADLAANFAGMLFYLNLAQPVMLKGKLQPPLLVWEGGKWKFSPHVRRDSDFFAIFVSDHFDEVLNPNWVKKEHVSTYGKSIFDRRTGVLERYRDEHGNRQSPGYFAARINELSSYYGIDYGYNAPPELYMRVDRVIYVPFPGAGGADAAVSVRDGVGLTALHHAAWRGDLATVQLLIEKGADVNAAVRSNEPYSSDWGNTPLHYAAAGGNIEVVRLLLDKGAKVGAANDNGVTPLHRAVAVAGVNTEIIKLLLERMGSGAVTVDAHGQTALHWAAGTGSAPVVRLLLSAAGPVAEGANAAADHFGQTALHEAVRFGNLATVNLLLDYGAAPSDGGGFGLTPLHLAARLGDDRIVKALLAKGASANVKDDFGATPLHDAAKNINTAGLAALLAAGGDVEARDGSGNTPLHIAAAAGHPANILLLLDHRATAAARNAQGLLPRDSAQARGFTQVVDALAQVGREQAAR